MNIPKQPTVPDMPIKRYTDITIEEAIKRIEEHKRIHKMNEPQAILISEALNMAVDALKHLWIEQRVETYSQLGGNNKIANLGKN